MNRALFVSVLLLAVGCAHQSTGRTPVNVAVTASPDAAQLFDVDKFQHMLQRELRGATLPTPRPLTLTVNFDSTDRLIYGEKASLASGRHVFWRTLFTYAGNDSVHGGADQSSGSSLPGRAYHDPNDYYTAFGGSYQKAHQEPPQTTTDVRTVSKAPGQLVVVGTYTITDSMARVLENEPIVMLATAPEHTDPRAQLQSMRSATQYLADAVIAVDAISAHGSSLSSSRTH
jgi:hypothetical protein